MKRPLLMVALCYGAGVVAADFSPVSLPAFPFLAGAASLAVLALGWARGRPALVWALLFAAGASNLAYRRAILSPHDLRTVAGDQPHIATLRGTLSETPYQRLYEQGEEHSWRTLAQLDVASIQLKNAAWQRAVGRVLVSTPGLLPDEFFGGRAVEIEGVLREPRMPVAEGVFDYRQYLSRQGIHYQFQVASTADWRLPPGADRSVRLPVADRFGAWAKAALGRGLPVEDEPLQLLWAMTLGWKTALNGEVSEPFMRSGTMHVFAISGLHIALIAGLLVLVLRVFRLPRSLCGFLVIPLIWSYTGLTGWQASAIRSTIMMTVIIAGWSLRRPSDLVNSLATAAFIILLWDPQQLFQASFQLSFFVVLSLALFTPVLEQIRQRLLAHDPFLPERLLPAWRRWLRVPLDSVTTALTVSLAAWLGSIPLIACYFHLFTPVSLLANLIVVPLSSAALACNLASLSVGWLLPGFAELFNHSAWFFMALMVRVSGWAAQVPGGCHHVATPPTIAFVFYYALLICVMAGWLARPKVRWWAGGSLALLALLWVHHWREERSWARLTVLPLNGGESVYFTPARSSHDLLVDCGNEGAFEFIVKPFLRGQGVNHPATFLLTQGDTRNVGAARRLDEEFAPDKVFISPVSFRSTAYRQLIKYFEERPGSTGILRRGGRLGPWTVLHPDETDHFPQADDKPVVMIGEIEGIRVILLSDLGKQGQNALMERCSDLRADIVVSGVPLQNEPVAGLLLDAMQPQLIIITDSEYPAPQRASPRLRERLASRGMPVLYTRQTGAVTLKTRQSRWEVTAMSGQRFFGSARRTGPSNVSQEVEKAEGLESPGVEASGALTP
jgi:competence protein ComEC